MSRGEASGAGEVLIGPDDGGTDDVIDDVRCFSCTVPLPWPLQVGSATVTSRQYDVVRLRTSGGLEGAAYAFGRGLPIAPIIERSLAPLLLGSRAGLPELLRRRLAGAYWPYAERGLFAVAASAVDLAVWDLLGRRLGTPLAAMLGQVRQEIPICAVGGYRRHGAPDSASVDGLQNEMADFVQLGANAVKLTIGGGEAPAVDARRLRAVREVVGPDRRVVVDAFRSFTSLEDALRRLRLLEHFDLSYVEDPFPESLASLAAELRHRTGLLIGLGENLSGHRAFDQLIGAGAVDVVRCDATVVGGVREFMATAAIASARGLEVSTHVHPAIHVHFAAALTNLQPAGLEYMLAGSGLDGLHELLGTQLEVRDGCAVLPGRPGLGIDWDWAAVERFASG
jgi:L-alanine-DL-glutamate epimerase-like enolase superfamily enzyme